MIGRLFEGWHLVLLLIVILVLFGGKRLPDAARGLGRSLRIFKSEIKEMQDEGERRPHTPPPPEPLQGRIVHDDTPRTTTPSEQQKHDI